MPEPRSLPPLPPPLAVVLPSLRRLRGLLVWGFGVSIVLHAIFGPIVGRYKAPNADAEQVSVVSLSRRTTIKLPSPAPTPTPTKPPTPTPTKPPTKSPSPLASPDRTAQPVTMRSAAPQAHLKINVFKTTTSQAGAPSTRDTYRALPGSQAGVPQGTLASPAGVSAVGAPAGASAAGPSTATEATPAITRTPPPVCAVPNVEAKTTKVAELVYPDFAVANGSAAGEVDVLVSLSATGAVTAATIYQSSGNARLDQAAVRAARASTYSPETVACQSVAGTYTFHASFTLK